MSVQTDECVYLFHGTKSPSKAFSYCRLGFPELLWWTDHLSSALGYGGPYVFWVRFPKGSIKPGEWQTRNWEPVAADRIYRLVHYKETELHTNLAAKIKPEETPDA